MRGPSALARINAIAFSTLRSAGGSVGGSDAVLPGPPFPELEERSIASDADANRLAGIRIFADVDQRIVGALFRLLDRVLKAAMMLIATIELADEVEPLALAAGDLVEVLFHLRGELDVDQVAEMRHAAAG